MKLPLPNNISSPQDLTSLILEIRAYARWHSHTMIKKRAGIPAESDETPLLTPAAAALMDTVGTSSALTSEDLDELIEHLQMLRQSAPQLSITLAAPVSNGLKKDLVNWCRENIAPNILVTFQFNSTLLGGMVIRYGSHILDESFRKHILAARNKFPEVLRNV